MGLVQWPVVFHPGSNFATDYSYAK